MDKEVKEAKVVEEVKFSKEDIEKGKGLGIVCYLGILCLIPYLIEKENPFVIYHAKQGLNFFLVTLIASFICGFSCFILIGFLLLPVLSIGSLVLMIMGIVNVCNGEAKELPIISKFKLIK